MGVESSKNLLPDNIELKNNSLQISEETKNSQEALNLKKETEENIKVLSNEKLSTIDNREFLSIDSDKRLQYITKDKSKLDDVLNGKKDSLEFTFTFNNKFNNDLWLKTTAGQVLGTGVSELSVNGQVFKREGLKGEFFNGNQRLIIHEGTKVENIKIRTPEEIKSLNDSVSKGLEGVPEENRDLVSEALKRNINPELGLLLFKHLGSKFNNKIENEEFFTQFDRLRPSIQMWDGKQLEGGKYPDELVIKLLKEFSPDKYKELAKEYGISDERILSTEKIIEVNEYSKNEFYLKAKSISENIESKYGIPKQVVLGMSLLESNNGQSKLTKMGNNSFGHKAFNGENTISMMTGEYRNGVYGKEKANFIAYDTLEDSFEGYAKLLTNSDRYKNAFNYKNDPEQFLYEIINAGYATLPANKYVSYVKSRLQSFGETLHS